MHVLLEELGFLHGLLGEKALDVRREVLEVRKAPLNAVDVSVEGLGQDALRWQEPILQVENGELSSSPRMAKHSCRVDVEEGLRELVLHTSRRLRWLSLLLGKD